MIFSRGFPRIDANLKRTKLEKYSLTFASPAGAYVAVIISYPRLFAKIRG